MKFIKKIILHCIPDTLKKAIIHEYKISNFDAAYGFHKTIYSQQGEDLALERFFENKRVGFYVDIGAYHPINYSNTHLFYKKGWRGINIEPNPDVVSIFKKIRPEDINLNFAIGERNKNLAYHKFNFPALNTLDKQEADLWNAKKGYNIESVEQIESFPLEEILDKFLAKNQKIDFLSVDAEGWDLVILKSNNWSKYRPHIIVAEENICSADSFKNSELINFLREKSYSIWSICCGSILFKNDLV